MKGVSNLIPTRRRFSLVHFVSDPMNQTHWINYLKTQKKRLIHPSIVSNSAGMDTYDTMVKKVYFLCISNKLKHVIIISKVVFHLTYNLECDCRRSGCHQLTPNVIKLSGTFTSSLRLISKMTISQ